MNELNQKGKQDKETVATLTDNILVQQLRDGDTTSFDTLFHRHYDRVYGLLFRLVGTRDEAEDLTQEVFLKLYNHAYRRGQFSRQREHNIGAWLYRVATNLGYNHIRGRQRRWQRNTVLVPDPEGAPGVDHEVERQEAKTAVRAALTRLPQRDAQLLLLRQMGLSYAELADACNVKATSVGKMLSRAADAFREAYEEEEIGDR